MVETRRTCVSILCRRGEPLRSPGQNKRTTKTGQAQGPAPTTVFFIGIYFFLTTNVFACPMCSDIISRGKDAIKVMRFGEGIAYSIILLFLVPLSMVGALVFVIWRANKRKRLDGDGDGEQSRRGNS